MSESDHLDKTNFGACAPDGASHLRLGWAGLTVNTGRLDRGLRFLGALLLIFGTWFTPVLGGDIIIRMLLTVFACLNLFAASTGWCAMYCATGWSTVRKLRHGGTGCGST